MGNHSTGGRLFGVAAALAVVGCGGPASVQRKLDGNASAAACATKATMPVRSKEVSLSNDAPYAARLEAAKARYPGDDAAPVWHAAYHAVMFDAQMDMRNYMEAERHVRAMIELGEDGAPSREAFAKSLGRQGRFEEAVVEARRAIEKTSNPFFIRGVEIELSCWEYRLGHRERARRCVEAIEAPSDKRVEWVYHAGLASFYAVTGDEKELRDSIGKALELDKSGGAYDDFARDTVFDRYRAQPWFVKLVGKTLRDEDEAEPAGQ